MLLSVTVDIIKNIPTQKQSIISRYNLIGHSDGNYTMKIIKILFDSITINTS